MKKAKPKGRGRIKGETTSPINTLALVAKIGVTRASKEIGVSTTTLHKARTGNVVSKVVEIAAQHALQHLGDTPAAARLAQAPMPNPIISASGDTALIVMEVPVDKAPMVQKFAEHLGAKLIAA